MSKIIEQINQKEEKKALKNQDEKKSFNENDRLPNKNKDHQSKKDIIKTSKKNNQIVGIIRMLINFIYQIVDVFKESIIQIIRGSYNQILTIFVILPIISYFGFNHNKNNDYQRSQYNVQQILKEEKEDDIDKVKAIIYDYSFQYFLLILEAMFVILVGIIFILFAYQDSLTYIKNVFSNVFKTKQLLKYRLIMLAIFLWLELVFVPIMSLFFVPQGKSWTSIWKQKFYFNDKNYMITFLLFLTIYFLGAVYVVYYTIFFIYWLKKILDN